MVKIVIESESEKIESKSENIIATLWIIGDIFNWGSKL